LTMAFSLCYCTERIRRFELEIEAIAQSQSQ